MQFEWSPQPLSRFWREIGLIGAVTGALVLAAYFLSVKWGGAFPRDYANYVLGRDFLNFWIYGREAWDPAGAARFYDIGFYNEQLRALIPWEYPTQQWSYPPHILLLAAPFGLLPYGFAYALWTALGLCAFYFAIDRNSDWRHNAALFLAPAAVVCIVSGQNSFLTAAALVAIFRWMDEEPVLAGILLGLLTVKPQLGVLFPLMLLLTRRWTVFFTAAATALALIGATAAIYGTEIWSIYLGPAARMQEYVLQAPSDIIKGLMPTAFMNARIAGLGAHPSYYLQGAVALFAVAAVVWVFIRPRDPLLSYCALLIGNALLTPYLMSYDLVVMGWLVLVLYRAPMGPAERKVLLALYWLPVIALSMAMLGLPGSALVLVATMIVLIHALTQGPATAILPQEKAH
jgi:hypothetical protein